MVYPLILILTMEIISNNLNKSWNWYGISSNSNITMDMINNNLDKPWNWHGVSSN